MSAWFESWTGFGLLDPWWLLLALVVPAALLIRRRATPAYVEFGPAAFLLRRFPFSKTAPAGDAAPAEPLPRSWRVRLLPVPRTLQALALLVVVIALARPVERIPLPLRTEGIDILLCLDISSSMTANDMDASRTRLEVAKDAAARFVNGRPDDRIGLLCFARYPDVRCPPTLDHVALRALLGEVTTVESDGKEDATGIGTAVARAAQTLDGGAGTSQVVILLTDGEENVATVDSPAEIAPLHAGQLCEQLGVRVYTIAAGVDAVRPGGGTKPLDTSQVERLSERTGGRFFAARDAAAVDGVYHAIDELEKVELDEPKYRVEERFVPFLALALVLLFGGRVLESTALEVLP